MNLTQIAHEKVCEYLPSLRYVVDATVGAGRDALFAASILENNGRVFCFDIQADAIERSKKLLSDNGYENIVEFFLCGHELMQHCIPQNFHGKINCFFFNLGWLPKSDKKISTKPETTIQAIKSALTLADKSQCVLSILCYKAHNGGMEEFRAVEKFLIESNLKFERITDEKNELSPELFVVKICA